MPTTQERDIKKYTDEYLKNDFEPTQVYYRRKKVIEILNRYSPKNILEVGCGLQSIFDFYDTYETFTVVEPSDVFCAEIQKSKSFNSKIIVIQDFLENAVAKLQSKQYDFIIISGLLHEVIKPKELLQSAEKICNKNTVVHINVPNAESLHLLWAYESGLIPKLKQLTETAKRFQQNTAFDSEILRKMCEECGFTVIDGDSYFLKPFNHTKMTQCVEMGIIDKQLLDGLYNITKYFHGNGSEIYVNCKRK